MHPVLIDSPHLPSYGFCLVLALTIAWWVARCRAGRADVAAWKLDLLAPIVVASGLVGSVCFGFLQDLAERSAVGGSRVLFGGLLVSVAVGGCNPGRCVRLDDVTDAMKIKQRRMGIGVRAREVRAGPHAGNSERPCEPPRVGRIIPGGAPRGCERDQPPGTDPERGFELLPRVQAGGRPGLARPSAP